MWEIQGYARGSEARVKIKLRDARGKGWKKKKRTSLRHKKKSRRRLRTLL